MRRAMYAAFIKTEAGSEWYNEPQKTGSIIAYECSNIQMRKTLLLHYTTQMNENTLLQSGFDKPESVTVKRLFTAYRQTKMIEF